MKRTFIKFSLLIIIISSLFLLNLSPVIGEINTDSQITIQIQNLHDSETAISKDNSDNEQNSQMRSPKPLTILGYHNLSEVEKKMFNTEKKYPSIAKVFDLGKLYPHENGTPKRTVQNRTIWALKISDNPGINESSEPEVLYMALHHAREWISVEVVLYVLDYLIDNYQTNQTIGNIINNTEIWIVPVVNPDGFNYSQYGSDDINATWNGDQWRKNCNETNGVAGFQDYGWAGGDGVDLNRNYGYKWGYDNSGSSPNTENLLYRGSAPFSEVETQIIRDLAFERDFKLMISYHSHSDLIIFPWAYDDFDTPHDALFNEIARNMSQYNGYVYGNPKDGVIYNCNGEATDWFYYNRTCLGFTFELHPSLYIPPPNQILSICQKNLEASLLIAKIADDPLKVLNSGIKGKVTTTKGDPITGVNISTTYAGETISGISDQSGHYKLRLPPGSYTIAPVKDGFWSNSFGVGVVQDSYSKQDITMADIIPPVISKVWATYNKSVESSNTFSLNSEVRINVDEQNQEENLTGKILITSNSVQYTSEKQSLNFDDLNDLYYYVWNTSGLDPGTDYVVEADLKDYDSNWDANGSNDTGPDLILEIVDNLPPIVSDVDSQLIDEGTVVDSDEEYEVGTTVRIIVQELIGEKWLNGTVRITSDDVEYNSGLQNLSFNKSKNYYYYDWSTSGLEPANDYQVETTLRDNWENIDSNGLPSSPDMTITLVDTIPPIIIKVDSKVDLDQDETYEPGSIVTITVTVFDYELYLSGYVMINSVKTSYSTNLTLYDIKSKPIRKDFSIAWDTKGLEVSDDYFIEARMTDKYYNYDEDGSNPKGSDLVITLVDTIAPIVYNVSSFVGLDNSNKYEIGSEVWIKVKEYKLEKNLTGTIIIESETLEYSTGFQELSYNSELFAYLWLWNTSGLLPAMDYYVEVTLSDRYNNTDEDGLSTTPDLKITFEDTTPPVVKSVWSRVNKLSNNEYESGSTVIIIIEELRSEPNLTGTIQIISAKMSYDSGELNLVWDPINKFYYYKWNTFSLKLSDDYSVETKLSDPWGNIDHDGLPKSPDLVIVLIDTTPPKQATDFNVKQDNVNKREINLYWNTTEIDTHQAIIYRSEKPIDNIDNLDELQPIAEVNDIRYTDILPSKSGRYYYIVFLKDSENNLNKSITDLNTASINYTEDKSDSPDSEPNLMSGNNIFVFLLIIIIIIVVLVVLSIRLNKKKKRVQLKEFGAEHRIHKEEDEYEDWNEFSKKKSKPKPNFIDTDITLDYTPPQQIPQSQEESETYNEIGSSEYDQYDRWEEQEYFDSDEDHDDDEVAWDEE